MNNNMPKSVKEILDDPKEDGNGNYRGRAFVKVVQCLLIRKNLEHRLTEIEIKIKINNWQNTAIIIGLILALVKLLFFGG